MAMTSTPLDVRIWRRIEKRGDHECWPWRGATNWGRNGRGGPYGKIGEGGKHGRTLLVHRVVYELLVGQIPEGHQVDHACGYPLCCNPAHLRAVTPWLNNAASTSPTAGNIAKEVCPQNHTYTPENTGYRKGENYRYCRTCARLAQRAKRERGLSYPEWLAEFHAGG